MVAAKELPGDLPSAGDGVPTSAGTKKLFETVI
jgi:hypothetical protein